MLSGNSMSDRSTGRKQGNQTVIRPLWPNSRRPQSAVSLKRTIMLTHEPSRFPAIVAAGSRMNERHLFLFPQLSKRSTIIRVPSVCPHPRHRRIGGRFPLHFKLAPFRGIIPTILGSRDRRAHPRPGRAKTMPTGTGQATRRRTLPSPK